MVSKARLRIHSEPTKSGLADSLEHTRRRRYFRMGRRRYVNGFANDRGDSQRASGLGVTASSGRFAKDQKRDMSIVLMW